MNESPAQIEASYSGGISIVDLIKQAYEKGLFKKLKCDGRKNAARMDISGLDKDRLIAYFDKRSEFNREDNTESGIHSAEFISDEFDIEIFDSFIQIYKLVDNESIQKLTIDDLQKLLSEDVDGVEFRDSTAFWYRLTTRSMWEDDMTKRCAFPDYTYHSLRDAMNAGKEFARDTASHIHTGIEEIYMEPNTEPIKTGAYWELRKGTFELITPALESKCSQNDLKKSINEHAYDDICRKVEQEVLNGEREVIAVDVDEWFDMMGKYQLKELDNLTTDISQGTGNVIVYYGYNVDNDTVYKYASY